MAILHAVQFSLPDIQSGYTLRTQAIVRSQGELGLKPVVVTSPRHPGGREEEVAGVRHYRCAAEGRTGSVWRRDYARVRALGHRIQEIAEERGDVRLVHAHSPVLCGMAALRAGRRLGIPVVYEVRGLWEEALAGGCLIGGVRRRLARRLEGQVCREAGSVVVISEGLREEFLGRGVSREKLHVIPNGVDTAVFRPRPSSPSWKLEQGLSDGRVILYLGALRGYEGLDLLLGAFPAIRERHPDAQLVIVGEGEAREDVAAQAERLGSQVSLLPAVPHAEVPDFYAAAEVVVYPRISVRATERVTPLKPLEAMAMGRAIVASDVGGLRELLTHGETARLFRAGSSEALSRACSGLLADEDERARLGGAAREAALARHDWKQLAQRYVDVYRSVGYR